MRKLTKKEQAVLDAVNEIRHNAYNAWRSDATVYGEDSPMTRVSLAYSGEACRIYQAVRNILESK